jgi:hypothetical protein
MRQGALGLLLVALVSPSARAQTETAPAAPEAVPQPAPTVALSPSATESVPPPPTKETLPPPPLKDTGFPWQKAGSVAIVGGIYGTAWAWVSAAWWTRKGDATGFTFMNEGAFSLDTYAGGADKMGHYYAAYLMNRGFAGILEWGGFPRTGSIITATALTTAFLTAVEYKDAYHLRYG